MSSRPANPQSGFTLIEVLVALAILGVSLAVLLHVMSESLQRAHTSQLEMQAGALAQSLLADTGPSLPLTPDDTAGKAGAFSWVLHVAPYGTDDDQRAWSMAALSISATVTWNDGNRNRSITLSTMRLAPKAKQ